MLSSQQKIISLLVLFVLCLFLFSQGLSVHGLEYRDDEIFYFQSTQEMIQNNNYISPTYFDQDRFQKPFLFYWLIILSYKIFGITWFAARFVSVIFAALSVCFTWVLASKLFNRRVAFVSAAILMSTPMFFRHAKNAVPDMALNFFVVSAMMCLVFFIKNKIDLRECNTSSKEKCSNYSTWLWFGFFVSCGLGFLIKGFAVLIIPFCSFFVYVLSQKKYFLFKEMRFGRGLLVFLSIALPWFIYMIFVHGREYIDYMIVDETKDRLLGQGQSSQFFNKIAAFFEHMLFYVRVLLSYFSPWSVFLVAAIPAAFVNKKDKPFAFNWLLIWFFVVFLFFSTMYFVINHYMLVLSTPFAIILAWFFCEKMGTNSVSEKIVCFLKRPFVIVLFSLAFFVCTIFVVFLLKGGLFAFITAAVLYVVLMYLMIKNKSQIFAPLLLAFFIMFISSQSYLLGKAGVTSHAVLQEFAQVVEHDGLAEYRIGVGSHDIHEKEFQVYFEQQVIKAADDGDDSTKYKLFQLFFVDQLPAYCLILQDDMDKYLNEKKYASLEILKESYIFRRRLYIDGDFFKALIQFDTNLVYHYLMEKIVLVRKGYDG